jgi:hypothetical protein
MTAEEQGAVGPALDPNGVSAPDQDMRLARVFIVKLVTPRERYGAPIVLPDGTGTFQIGSPPQDQIPLGFTPIWGGKAAVRIEACDRDRLGAEVSPAVLAALLLHPGPEAPPKWATGPSPLVAR